MRKLSLQVIKTPSDALAFYESKTQAILHRFGPGPRVHYHTGLVEEQCLAEADPAGLRELLVLSQENLLYKAAKIWQFETLVGREILDVGCGLGGSSLYLAQEFGARITALTIAPSHAELVKHFASQAGVSHLVIATIGDALEVEGIHRFDAAIAIDSSSSFPRTPWFRRLRNVLRPKGRVLIADCFLVDRKYEQPFNAHWCAQIGTLPEYLDSAHAAGFYENTVEDQSSSAERFWSLSLAHMRAAAAATFEPETISTTRLDASRRIHALVREGLASGGLRYLLLALNL